MILGLASSHYVHRRGVGGAFQIPAILVAASHYVHRRGVGGAFQIPAILVAPVITSTAPCVDPVALPITALSAHYLGGN
jgi:hypothetical protein